jgi:hypothetical protein
VGIHGRLCRLQGAEVNVSKKGAEVDEHSDAWMFFLQLRLAIAKICQIFCEIYSSTLFQLFCTILKQIIN